MSRIGRTVEDGLFGPESGARLLVAHVGLTVLIGLRVALGPYRQLAETPDALVEPVAILSWLDSMPPAGVIVAIQVVGVVAALAATLRRRTRLTYAVAWLCYLVLAGLFGSRGKVMHNDLLLLWCSAVFLLAPTDLALGDRERRPVTGWPVRVSMVVAALIYFFAGYQKLRRSGLDWAIGDNFRYVMLWGPSYGQARWEAMADWIGARLWASRLSSASLFLFELTFPIAVFVRWLRPWYAAGAVVLHVLTWLLLGLDYWVWAGAVLILFFDWPAIVERVRARRRPVAEPAAVGG